MINIGLQLLEAIKTGDHDSVQSLLHDGADPSCADSDGYSALHWACQDGDQDIVNTLLTHGANLNARDREGFSPVEVAINKRHSGTARLLLSNGADTSTQRDGSTLWHAACAACDDATLRVLVREHVKKNLNQHDFNGKGRAPIHLAAQEGCTACIQILIDNGVDPNDVDGKGFASIHIAAAEGHGDAVRALLEGGAEIDAPCMANNGQTALHIACVWEHPDVVAILLRAGASVVRCDNDGKTPLDCALQSERIEVIRLMKQ